MDKINELKDKAYEAATKKYGETTYIYSLDARTKAMIAYALLTIAEKLTAHNDKEIT